MRKIYTDDYHAQRNIYVGPGRRTRRGAKPYGLLRFLFDIVMIAITGGFWLVWIFIREMRNR